MYEEFFGLRARPFGITPSADLFFHSSAHRRTLAWLQGQVLAGEPLIVLTGSIGSGKTTVLQVLLRNLSDQFAPALVVSTQLDEIELTRAVLLAFGARTRGESLDGLRTDLRVYLEGLRPAGRQGLVVVDEAQNLSPSALRYLLHLPALHGDVEERPLQVIVSGQPAIPALLAEAAGVQAVDELPICELRPMGASDTGSYVRHRLRAVGTTDGPTFSAEAIDRVQTTTGGLPRLVNRLCDRVLMSACLHRTRDIDAVRVADVAAELRDELGDSELPFPSADNPDPVQPDPTLDAVQADPPPPLAAPSAPRAVGSAVDSGPAVAGPSPSTPQVEKRTDHRASRRPLPHGAAAAAAALLALSLGWLAYDRSSPRPATSLEAAPPASVVAPAERADTAGVARPHPGERTLSAESLAQPATADAGASARSATGEVQVLPAPPSQPIDARAAFGLAPFTEPTAGPPAAAPAACSDPVKALGLCP